VRWTGDARGRRPANTVERPSVDDTLFLATVFALRVLTSIDTFAWPLPWLHPAVPYLGKYVYPTAIVAETGTIHRLLRKRMRIRLLPTGDRVKVNAIVRPLASTL